MSKVCSCFLFPDLLASFFSPVVVASAVSFLPSGTFSVMVLRTVCMPAHISRITISAQPHTPPSDVQYGRNTIRTWLDLLLYLTVKRPALNQVPAPSKFPYVVCKLKGAPAIKKVGAIDPSSLSCALLRSFRGREEREEARRRRFKISILFKFPPPLPRPTVRETGGRRWAEFFILFRIYILPALRIPYRMEPTPGVFDWNYNGE